jgi:hypothetical protein
MADVVGTGSSGVLVAESGVGQYLSQQDLLLIIWMESVFGEGGFGEGGFGPDLGLIGVGTATVIVGSSGSGEMDLGSGTGISTVFVGSTGEGINYDPRFAWGDSMISVGSGGAGEYTPLPRSGDGASAIGTAAAGTGELVFDGAGTSTVEVASGGAGVLTFAGTGASTVNVASIGGGTYTPQAIIAYGESKVRVASAGQAELVFVWDEGASHVMVASSGSASLRFIGSGSAKVRVGSRGVGTPPEHLWERVRRPRY